MSEPRGVREDIRDLAGNAVDLRIEPRGVRMDEQRMDYPAYEIVSPEKLHRLKGTRLARECAKLDPAFEGALADEGLGDDLEAWPDY